jgi:hypothetical protein
MRRRTVTDLRMLHPGDRVRLRPGERARLWAFGRGMEEYAEALFTLGQTDVTFAGRSFFVREDGPHLVLYDDEATELLAHEPGRRGRDRIGELEFTLPGKKPGRLGKVAELRVQNGIVVVQTLAATPPLPVLFACIVVVWRSGMAKTPATKSDWDVQAGQSMGLGAGF